MPKLAAIGFRHNHMWQIIEELLAEPQMELAAICEDYGPLAEKALKKWPVRSFDDPLELLEQVKPDIVALCPVNSQKGSIIIECFRRGIGVFADKPMFIDLDALEEAERIRLAASPRPAFMGGLSLREMPLFVTAKKLIRDGVIGEVASVYTRRPHKLGTNRNPWELNVADNGGVLIDLGIHDLDFVMDALNTHPIRVVAGQSNLRFRHLADFVDNGSMRFDLANGMVATIEPNWLNPDASDFHGDCCMMFMGTKGFLTVSETAGTVFITTLTEKQHEVEPIGNVPGLARDFMRQHRGEDFEFEPADFIEANRWVIRATESARNGGAPIEA
jgi:predicted dehydrogenase